MFQVMVSEKPITVALGISAVCLMSAVLIASHQYPPVGPVVGGSWITIKAHQVGCSTIDLDASIAAIGKTGDAEARKKAIDDAVVRGDCQRFEPDDFVNIIERANDMIKVRKRGELAAFWLDEGDLR